MQLCNTSTCAYILNFEPSVQVIDLTFFVNENKIVEANLELVKSIKLCSNAL